LHEGGTGVGFCSYPIDNMRQRDKFPIFTALRFPTAHGSLIRGPISVRGSGPPAQSQCRGLKMHAPDKATGAVVPAKAGIPSFQGLLGPRFRGGDAAQSPQARRAYPRHERTLAGGTIFRLTRGQFSVY